MKKQQKHFVLVHGSCHGAWSWFKIIPLLEKSGHRVTAIELAASGINMKSINELSNFHDYAAPLLEFLEGLAPEEKVVLVGHSSGGISLALASESFPQKIEVAVYVAAFMPDTVHEPSYVLTQHASLLKELEEGWLDTEFICNGDPTESPRIFMFGPKAMALLLYQQSPPEDLLLAELLKRPSSLFVSHLSKADKLSETRYGSVRRVYVTCTQDRVIPVTFQHWMIENGGAAEVKELHGADHMPMFSMPQQFGDVLVSIASTYA